MEACGGEADGGEKEQAWGWAATAPMSTQAANANRKASDARRRVVPRRVAQE